MTERKTLMYLREYEDNFAGQHQDDTLLLQTALFLEEVFHMEIQDNEIHPANLGSYEAIKEFLLRKQRGDACAVSVG